MSKPTAVMDIECYRNYFLVMFKRVDTGAVRAYEMWDDGALADAGELRTVMANYRVVTFNGNSYDLPMLAYALQGKSCSALKDASDAIIVGNLRSWQFEDQFAVKVSKTWDHIDLIEVAFGDGSLKLYGGRLHSKRLQDLPIEPSAIISPEDRENLRSYCKNDLQTTIDLWNHLQPQIDLREHMTAEYREDLRSKSDAQIAETVIRKQCGQILGGVVRRPEIPPGTSFKYEPPRWLTYTTPLLRKVLEDVSASTFFVNDKGSVEMPPALDERTVPLGGSVYRMGIGGLHSSEQVQAVVADEEHSLSDHDVTSFYPSIILRCELSPLHLKHDNAFLQVYRTIFERRIDAKRRGDDVVSNVLKIVLNGSFGKFGSRYSALYSPHLMVQVTLTGQLSLLMLIEALEARGVPVVSGNTDGIVIRCPRGKRDVMYQVIKWWEQTTGFGTEETRYRAVFSRDVNNYVALKEKGGFKGKGAFASVSISKNPQNTICVEAALALLERGTPIRETIRSCVDIRKFITVRSVRGGAVRVLNSRYDDTLTPGKKRESLLANGWSMTVPGPLKVARFARTASEAGQDVETAYRLMCGEDEIRYIGKVVRFYIGRSAAGALHYMVRNDKGNRNKVPGSESSVPVMELPESLPPDVDYEFYEREAESILADIGATPRKLMHLLFGATEAA